MTYHRSNLHHAAPRCTKQLPTLDISTRSTHSVPVPLSPGSHFADGRFLIRTLLAAGAACDTYRVTDRASGSHAALRVREFTDAAKTTRVALLHDRFRREIEIRNRMKFAPRTYVLTAYEMLETPTALALLIEFAEHGSLADRLRSGPPPIPQALHWLRNAASGLQALHDQGITHGDLTPAHIFLTGNGDAKIGDLGLAQTPSSIAQNHTPQPLTPTSDVFRLGCIAFELLTGRTWAVAKRSVATPSQLRTEIPLWLDEAVMRMLSALPSQHNEDPFDPPQRFVDMLGVLKALEQADTTTASAREKLGASSEIPNTTMTTDQQWLQARVEGLEKKIDDQQRDNVDLAARHRLLNDKVLPRRTFIAGGVGMLLGLVFKSIGDLLPPIFFLPPQTIVIQNYSAASASNDAIELAPGVQLDLASVPAGRYAIGSDPTKDALTRADELPQNTIEHTAFWIGRTEVTVAQFAAFVQAESYRTTAEIDGVSRTWIDGTAIDVRGAPVRAGQPCRTTGASPGDARELDRRNALLRLADPEDRLGRRPAE